MDSNNRSTPQDTCSDSAERSRVPISRNRFAQYLPRKAFLDAPTRICLPKGAKKSNRLMRVKF